MKLLFTLLLLIASTRIAEATPAANKPASSDELFIQHLASHRQVNDDCPLGKCDDASGYCQVPSFYREHKEERCIIDLEAPQKLHCYSRATNQSRTLICTDDGSGLMPWQGYTERVFYCIFQRH